jgi:hypothetical protein
MGLASLAVALDAGCGASGGSASPPSPPPPPGETRLLGSVTDHGVTWTFSQPVEVGSFVTGDPYVVGPATVVAIHPAPGGGRNGSVVNVPADASRSGFDDRTEGNRYDPSLGARPPIPLVPGDSLASSISLDVPGQVDNWLREGNGERSSSPVRSVSVLTCVGARPPADAFRPSYAGRWSRLHRLADVDRSLLPRLAPPRPVATDDLEELAGRLSRPWVDNLFYGFDAQVDYMAMYGREMGRVAGIASLLVMMDLPPGQRDAQDRLLVGLVQRGIDLWGLVQAGHPGWIAHGGHGSGRKWPIVLAGILLGDAGMRSPTATFPEVRFGEDLHTAFAADLPHGPAWNGATVVYTGHMGVWKGQPVSSTPGWGPYEHLAPDRWLARIGEDYRRCCTSIAWVGEALAARLMKAEGHWGHDAFFAYADRWMDGSRDAADTQRILDLTGWDYRAGWQRQGQAWDELVDEMWARYR